jgi:hypothetical protein
VRAPAHTCDGGQGIARNKLASRDGDSPAAVACCYVLSQRGDINLNWGFTAMDLGSLAHLFNSVTLDDSSLALIALLAGMAAGYLLTNWRDQQLRARKLKIDRKR